MPRRDDELRVACVCDGPFAEHVVLKVECLQIAFGQYWVFGICCEGLFSGAEFELSAQFSLFEGLP